LWFTYLRRRSQASLHRSQSTQSFRRSKKSFRRPRRILSAGTGAIPTRLTHRPQARASFPRRFYRYSSAQVGLPLRNLHTVSRAKGLGSILLRACARSGDNRSEHKAALCHQARRKVGGSSRGALPTFPPTVFCRVFATVRIASPASSLPRLPGPQCTVCPVRSTAPTRSTK